MERFPVLSKQELDEKQRALWDELTLGPRGFYTGGEEAKRLPCLHSLRVGKGEQQTCAA